MQRSTRKCSFCGKPQGEVRLIAGPRDVAICNLCVALCQEILSHPEGPPEPPHGLTVRAQSEPRAR